MSERAPPKLQAHNVDELRASIDSGGTGDKVPFPDPAMAPLGTDAEAAGFPASNRELKLEVLSQAGTPVSISWPSDTIGVVAYCAAVFVVCLALLAIVLIA